MLRRLDSPSIGTFNAFNTFFSTTACSSSISSGSLPTVGSADTQSESIVVWSREISQLDRTRAPLDRGGFACFAKDEEPVLALFRQAVLGDLNEKAFRP